MNTPLEVWIIKKKLTGPQFWGLNKMTGFVENIFKCFFLNDANRRKINRPWPKSNQFWRCSGYISMQNCRPLLPCVLQEMPGNLSVWTNGQAIKRSRLVGWTNGPMYRWKEGISGFGWMDEQPENMMHPAPKGRGIKIYFKRVITEVPHCGFRITLEMAPWC